eukprot:gene2734-3929_t
MHISPMMKRQMERKKCEAPEKIENCLNILNITKNEQQIISTLTNLYGYSSYFNFQHTKVYIIHLKYLLDSKNTKIVEKLLLVLTVTTFKEKEENLKELSNLIMEKESILLENINFTVLILQIFNRRFREHPKLVRKMLPFFSKISTKDKDVKRELIYIFEFYLEYYDEIEFFLNSGCFGFVFNEPRLLSSIKIMEYLIIGNEKTRKIINKDKKRCLKYKNSNEQQKIIQLLSLFNFVDKRKISTILKAYMWNNMGTEWKFIIKMVKPTTLTAKCSNFMILDDWIIILFSETLKVRLFRLEDVLENRSFSKPIQDNLGSTNFSFFRIASIGQYCYVEYSHRLMVFKFFNENGEKIKDQIMKKEMNVYGGKGISTLEGNQYFLVDRKKICEFKFDGEQFILVKIHETFELDFVTSVAINSNCSLLALNCGKYLIILDMNQGFRIIFNENFESNNKICLIFMKNDPSKLVISDDYFVKVFDVSKNKNSLNDCLIQVIPLKIHGEISRCICESQDGKYIYVGSTEGIFQFKTQNILNMKRLMDLSKQIDTFFSFE